MKQIIIIISVFACIALNACTDIVTSTETSNDSLIAEENHNPRSVIKLSPEEQYIVEASNSFALNILKEIIKDNSRTNFNASPLSLAMVMALAGNGALGDTRNEIAKVLGFKNMEAANALNRRLTKELSVADLKTNVSIANSIWFDNQIRENINFTNYCRDTYRAEIFKTDFSSESSVTAINTWAKDKTNGYISELIDTPFGENIAYSLVSALHFKGEWQIKFDEGFTYEQDFNNIDGSISKVQMMHNSDITGAGIYDDSGASWISLFFGNKSYSLVLILPDKGVNLEKYIVSLEPDTMSELFEKRLLMSGRIALPKFTVESRLDMLPYMRNLGIESAFGKNADFSLICDNWTNIGMILQKTHIEIDECGAIASGGTITGEYISPDPIKTNINLVFDRPFAFIIREESAGIILFTGCITQL